MARLFIYKDKYEAKINIEPAPKSVKDRGSQISDNHYNGWY